MVIMAPAAAVNEAYSNNFDSFFCFFFTFILFKCTLPTVHSCPKSSRVAVMLELGPVIVASNCIYNVFFPWLGSLSQGNIFFFYIFSAPVCVLGFHS